MVSTLILVLGLLSGSPAHAGGKLELTKAPDVFCFLTDVEEFKKAFGDPVSQSSRPDGDSEWLELRYENGYAGFKTVSTPNGPCPVLVKLDIAGKDVNVGCSQKRILRDDKDLMKLGRFWGLTGVSLKAIDVSKHFDLIEKLPFDTQTEWPEKIPDGFKPAKILEIGKNPGLGIRSLHQQGVTGRGVGIAIIDQALLLDHVEYRDQIVHYDGAEVLGLPPQMHGSPVASIAGGRTLGVAPGAKLYYFAIPKMAGDNRSYAEALDRVLLVNQQLPKNEKIRVVSISFGGFKTLKNLPLWEAAVKRAEAQGVSVLTTSIEGLDYMNLNLDFSKDPDSAESYAPTQWGQKAVKNPERLYVPGGNRTVASYRGPDVYQSDREAGLSWSTPYLAGVAALVYQVNPSLKTAQVLKLMKETATPLSFGKVISPKKLVETAKKLGGMKK